MYVALSILLSSLALSTNAFGAGLLTTPEIGDTVVCKNSACLLLPAESLETEELLGQLESRPSQSLLLKSDLLGLDEPQGSLSAELIQMQSFHDERLELFAKLQASREHYFILLQRSNFRINVGDLTPSSGKQK